MGIDTSALAFPKPRPRVLDRADRKRAADKRGLAFRRAVWARDGGICQHCHRRVRRCLDLVPDRGEVHHLKTRGAHPEQKYDVRNGILLCAGCHVLAQRGEIRVKERRG